MNRVMKNFTWLCLFVAIAAVQQVSSDQQHPLRNVFAIINGGPLKPLSFIEKSITKDIDLLAREIGNQDAPINSLEDIDVCINRADRLIEKYIGIFSSGRVTKKRIDERNSVERAAALLRALPLAAQSCDLNSYLDLMALLKGAAGDSGLLEPRDQVRSSILVAVRLHREHCSSGYYARALDAISSIDSATKESVERLFDVATAERVFPGLSANSMVLFEARDTTEALANLSKHLLDKLEGSASSEDEDEFVSKVLVPQLLQPCYTFIEPLEAILLPAKLDLALADAQSLTAIDSRMANLVDTWARFHICSSIHYNEPTMIRSLKMNRFSGKSAD